MTTPSPVPVAPEDAVIFHDLSPTDRQETFPQRRSSKPSYLKSALMDGGDAATSADHPESDAVATSKRPLSVISGDHYEEGEMAEHESQPDEDIDFRQLQGKGTLRYESEYLEETEEDLGFHEEESEVENLVKYVLQKVKMELILEKMTNSLDDETLHLSHNASGCGADSSECSVSTDEENGSFADEIKELCDNFSPGSERQVEEGENRPDMDELEIKAGSCDEAEQQLDGLIRSVIEKQSRDLASKKMLSGPGVTNETAIKRNTLTGDEKKTSGLNFQFHDVMQRLMDDRIKDPWWEDEIDIVDGVDEFAEVWGEEQALKVLHEAFEEQDGGTERPQENKKDVSHPLRHKGSESMTAEPMIPQTTHEVQAILEVHELQDEVQGSHGGMQEETKEEVQEKIEMQQKAKRKEVQVPDEDSKGEIDHCLPLRGTEAMGASEVPNEAQGVPNEEGVEGKREEIFDDTKMNEEDEQEDESASEDADDYDDLLTSEDDEELDSMVGFVINSARSSLMNNFDVFSFNKSSDFNGNTKTATEDRQERKVSESDGEARLLVCSEDCSSEGKSLPISEVSAMGDFNKAVDSCLQVAGNVGDEVEYKETENVDKKEKKLHAGEGEVQTPVGGKVKEINYIKNCPDDQYFFKTHEKKDEETKKAADTTESEFVPLDASSPNSSVQQDSAHDSESLKESLKQPSVKSMHVTTATQSHEGTETQPRVPESDSPSQEKTSLTVTSPKVTLTADDIASDSDDDDDDFYEAETKPAVSIKTAENDWECLAIQQISKSQSHAWYPDYNTSHLGVGETLKKQDEVSRNNFDDDESTGTKPAKIPSNESIPLSQLPSLSDSTADNTSSQSQTAKFSKPQVVSSLANKAHSGSTETESGAAVINDGLRKEIVLLEQRLKELALELTFLGDRNWRLEAYIDCLIKTLEVLDVTDVVDLDEKTLPLCLFKVKVKAGYKLGSYNGIPSRALWSYNEEGRQPPYVDLSGRGDTDKPAQRPDSIDFTPVPSSDDDVGLSVSQMYQYESQLEDMSIQNEILEAQLQEAQDLLQAMMDDMAFPGNEQVSSQSLQQQQPQLRYQGVQTAPPQEILPQNLGVLQQQVREYHLGGEQFWQQAHPQQQQQQQQPILASSAPPGRQPECYVVHEGKEYPLPLPQHLPSTQHQPLPQQQLQQQQHHHYQQYQHYPSELQPQQQHHHYQQYQHYPSELQPQQQQQLQQPQPNWDIQAAQEETVAPNEWDCGEELSLHDPLEWPTLTESQARSAGHPHPRNNTEHGQNLCQQQWIQPRPIANTGPASQVSHSAATVSADPAKDKSTLHSSLAQPASTGSIPTHENRHKVSYQLENTTKEASSGSTSSQSLRRGRQFESNSRNQARHNHRSLDQSRSGFGTSSRGQRQEESMIFDYWDPPLDPMALSFPGEFPVNLHGEAWHHESSAPFHNVRNSAPSHNPPPHHHPRNMDRNRRFFHGDSFLDSYRPDFSDFQDSSFNNDLIESSSVSSQTFKFNPGYEFDKFSSPPSTRGVPPPNSSTRVGGLSYSSRRHDKRSATPTRRGKPVGRARLPRHSSCHSPLKSCPNPERTYSDSK